MALRSSWEGFLRFNLISVPVKAYSAAVSGGGKVGFNQIHKDCGNRIRYQKVCPVHGEVANEDIVPGYEYTRGQYVTVPKAELEALRAEDEKAIDIDVFIRPEVLDPIYDSGRTYYLAPDGKVAEKPYAVLQRVMAKEGRQAIARVVFAGRQQMALLRPVEGLLTMTLLNYADQVKQPGAFKDELPDVDPAAEEIRLAQTLIETATADKFDFAQYDDEYTDRVAQLIESKATGKGKRPKKASQPEQPVIINLMDALRQSLAKAKRTRPGATANARKAQKRRAPRTRRRTG